MDVAEDMLTASKERLIAIGNVPDVREFGRETQQPRPDAMYFIKLGEDLESEGAGVSCREFLKIRGIGFLLPIEEIRDPSKSQALPPADSHALPVRIHTPPFRLPVHRHTVLVRIPR
jgi:hypothetical protein